MNGKINHQKEAKENKGEEDSGYKNKMLFSKCGKFSHQDILEWSKIERRLKERQTLLYYRLGRGDIDKNKGVN